jgi:Uma2 family endonuclease
VIEVVSPSDSIKQQQEKMLLWMQNGCRLAWLIQPAEKNVWIYRDGQKEAEYLQGLSQQLSGEQVLPEFILDLSLLKF